MCLRAVLRAAMWAWQRLRHGAGVSFSRLRDGRLTVDYVHANQRYTAVLAPPEAGATLQADDDPQLRRILGPQGTGRAFDAVARAPRPLVLADGMGRRHSFLAGEALLVQRPRPHEPEEAW